MKLRTVALALALDAAALPSPIRAQRIEGTVTAQRVTYRFSDFGTVSEQSGTYVGGSAALGVGRVRIALRGMIGQLGDPNGSLPERDVRITGISVGLVAAPWLEIGADALARHVVADPDTTIVRLVGVYARSTIALGGAGLTGTAELTYYPVGSVVHLDPLQTALQAGVGLRYTPPTSGLSLFAGYRLMRIDYQSTGFPARLEQDQSLVFELSLRGGRN